MTWRAGGIGLGLALALAPASAQQVTTAVPNTPSVSVARLAGRLGGSLAATSYAAPTAPAASSAQTAGGPGTAGSARPQAHAFWDRTNILLFSGVAVFRGLDYASTRNMQARGREEVLLPDDVVNNSGGFAALEAAGTATSVGLSYWMHHAGHHKLERWISIVHIGVTGFGVVRNYSLESKHAAPPPP